MPWPTCCSTPASTGGSATARSLQSASTRPPRAGCSMAGDACRARENPRSSRWDHPRSRRPEPGCYRWAGGGTAWSILRKSRDAEASEGEDRRRGPDEPRRSEATSPASSPFHQQLPALPAVMSEAVSRTTKFGRDARREAPRGEPSREPRGVAQAGSQWSSVTASEARTKRARTASPARGSAPSRRPGSWRSSCSSSATSTTS